MTDAAFNLCSIYAEENEHAKVKELLTKLAVKGNARAQYNLAVTLEADKNIEGAKSWYLQAANQKYLNAQYNLGMLYKRAGNAVEAKKWLLDAAKQGDKEAWLYPFTGGEIIGR